MGFRLEECIPLNEFVFIETGEGTSTGVRAEEKARQRPASSFPRGLERVVSRYSLPTHLCLHLRPRPTELFIFLSIPDQQLQMNTRLHNLSPFCRNGLRVETLLAHEQYWLVSNLDRRIFSYPAPSH